eukprot:GHVN01092496.1.p1 GENE.GHVN01092496.1~~GHVN01092496.1.p1  ORF type:complete len:876 (-),score=178.78 GHVN01092496.1:187-2814(-)
MPDTFTLSKEVRRQQRKMRKQEKGDDARNDVTTDNQSSTDYATAAMLLHNEDELLEFVANVNRIYQEKLDRPAPFMTFVICGMQSAGKSTVMERFMGAVINIVQEGTGTRCPLDTTCIHDDSSVDPKCDLSGKDLASGSQGKNLSMKDTFERIVSHNQRLAKEDSFSTQPLRLIFRSKAVQNMRFVDTPGIIVNKGQGKDNRDEIKTILRSEIGKPNTKLCILLEPKEFSTNAIIDFCDETFGGRDQWVSDATFLMTKFDKQLEDSRSGSKTNKFFDEFKFNNIHPHLVITPTLPKEDLPPEELYAQRQDLLDTADKKEEERFKNWRDSHKRFLQENPADELFCPELQRKVGFPSAKKLMRQIMLRDTADRLPEVLGSLRKDLASCEKESKQLSEKMRFNSPAELKSVVGELLNDLKERLTSYLDGDLAVSMKFPERLQTLEDEIEEEEDSEWSERPLNHYSEAEEIWRDRIEHFEGKFPEEIQPDKLFLGGKQVQRAMQFFATVFIDSLPDPSQLQYLVPNATGYLSGGLQHENWERAIVEIIKVCLKDVSHPGINYLIKHIGSIFRRLFLMALDDVKRGEALSSLYNLLPDAIEKFLTADFDKMLWTLMETASQQTHTSMEPMYSTVDPTIPTFLSLRPEENEGLEEASDQKDGWFKKAMCLVFSSGEAAKKQMKEDHRMRATIKKAFLPEMRTAMITDKETGVIIDRSYQYIVGLMDFNLLNLKFMINHFLYLGFKKELNLSTSRILSKTDWSDLIVKDPEVENRLKELDEQIIALKESLQDVARMQRKMPSRSRGGGPSHSTAFKRSSPKRPSRGEGKPSPKPYTSEVNEVVSEKMNVNEVVSVEMNASEVDEEVAEEVTEEVTEEESEGE